MQVLDIQGLKKTFEGSTQPYLFSGVSAQIAQPTVIALLGASGQGKSTLLRILSLLDEPDEGDILLQQVSFRSMDQRSWRMKVCYVAQQAVMLSGTIEDNLKIVSYLHKKPHDHQLMSQLLKQLDLEHLQLGKSAADLSGGEKQRISLIRSLLLRPEVLLLDEITASLDMHSMKLVEQLLLNWHREEGTTLIWVTHNLEQAHSVSQRIWFMGNGTLLEDSPTTEFFQQPATDMARSFLQLPSKGV
ncbi:ATP-binding cassette domain-containing protein [Paenibacillus sp. GP183]|jgi:putative ABC transport system ATP-binding protein|uniref:ABC transporter ATP-binding protein n=1 Tax=Paenibacillus sp. GP183 TaxID=1882751 RepID=UPI0008951564|nr:ATP-binding cassette domain-containing protein [Paenibacillus sp. GP183]SEB54222.1 putative ABC transport system ATP-binding protein [Paenibacillus sp. GP183]